MPIVLLACVILLGYGWSTRWAWHFTRSAATPTQRAPPVFASIFSLPYLCHRRRAMALLACSSARKPLWRSAGRRSAAVVIFTAVVLGGTRSAAEGTARLARSWRLCPDDVVDVLLVLDVSAYCSTIAEGASSSSPSRVVARPGFRTRHAASLRGGTRLRIARWHPAGTKDVAIGGCTANRPLRARRGTARRRHFRYATRRPTIRPPFLRFLSDRYRGHRFWLGSTVLHWSYSNSLILLLGFLAILALGRGAVILTADSTSPCHGPSACPAFCSRAWFKAPIRRWLCAAIVLAITAVIGSSSAPALSRSVSRRS